MRSACCRWLAACLALGLQQARAQTEVNQLSPQEQAAGWRLLFDGTSTAAWRGAGQEEFPAGCWGVEDGCLKYERRPDEERAGDIITREEFTDFELRWDWRIEPGGNSGVKYLLYRRGGRPDDKFGWTGLEYQLIDDERHSDARRAANRTAGAVYDLLAPGPKDLRPPGQFNESRIVVQGDRVEHWLNGVKILEFELGSEEFKAAIGRSKYRGIAGFGTKRPSPILLQDHGNPVRFRNLKIRDLSAAPPAAEAK